MRKIILSVAALAALLGGCADTAFAAEKWVRVVNARAAFPLFYVYITPAGQSTWGDDQLGGTVLAAGDSRTWQVPWNGCRVDLRAVTFTGMSAEQRGVDICGGGTWTIRD